MQIINIKNTLPVLFVAIIGLSGCTQDNSSKNDADQAAFTAAEDLLNEQDWNGAIDAFGDLYVADPASPEVQEALGRAYAGQAGIGQEQLLTSLKVNSEDGEKVTSLSNTTIYSFVNYYNENQYQSRVASGRQAVVLLMPGDGDINQMTDEDKAELGMAAAAQTILLLGGVVKDTDINNKSEEEINELVSDSFDDIKDELKQLTSVVSETQSEIADNLADGLTSSIAATMVIDDFFSDNGLSDGDISVDDVAGVLHKFTPAD